MQNTGNVNADIELLKAQEQVKNPKQQRYGLYLI